MSLLTKSRRALLHAFVAIVAIGVVYASTPLKRRILQPAVAVKNKPKPQPAAAPCPSTLYAIDSGTIFLVDPVSGATSPVASVPPAYAMKRLYLRFTPDGTLYGRDTTSGRRIIMDISTGAVTDDGPDVDAIDANSDWFQPTWLAEGSTPLGYQMKNTPQQVPTAIRTVDSNEPFASSTLFPISKPAAHNLGLGNVVTRDATSFYWVGQDMVYRTTPGSWPALQPSFSLNAFELSQDAVMSDLDENGHFYVIDGNVLVNVNPVAGNASSKSLASISQATDVMVRPCPTGGVRIAPTQQIATNDLGASATFHAVLTAAPASDVTFTLSSSDAAEGTVSPSSLTFNTGNWSVAQQVTVTGTISSGRTGATPYTIVTSAASSADPNYSGRFVSDVRLLNLHQPLITAGGPTTFCSGGAVTLTSSVTSGNQWYRDGSIIGGATGQQYTATVSGGYTVVQTIGSVSSRASAMTTVTVQPLPSAPVITASGSTTFCAGGSVTLTSNVATNVQWYLGSSPIPGATQPSYIATAPGTYSARATSVSGCTSPASNAISVTVNAKPEASIAAPGSVGASSSGNFASVADAGAGASYNWSITGGTITGGAGTRAILFSAAPSGTLTVNVTVTSAAGCADTKSANVAITAAQPAATHFAVSAPASVTHGTPFNIDVTALSSQNATVNSYTGTVHFTSSSAGTLPPDYTFVAGDNGAHTFSVTLTNDFTQTITATDGITPSIAGSASTFVNPVQAATCAGTLYASLTDGKFYSVDTATGALTYVSTVDPFFSGQNLGLRVAPDGTIYGRANARRLIVDIPTGAVTDDGPDFESGWLPGAYLPEGSAVAGYQSGDGTLTTFRRIDSLEPFSTTALPLPFSGGGTTPSLGLSNAITRDGQTFYRLNGDFLYSADLTAASPVLAKQMDVSALGLAPGDVATDITGNGHLFVWATGTSDLYDIDPANAVSTLVHGGYPNWALDLVWRPCPVGGVRIVASSYPTLSTSESGTTATFQAVLSAPPAADVTVGFTSSDTNEGTVSPSTLTFTTGNWSTPQPVTITGVHDFAIDGTKQYSVTGVSSSADPNYNGRAVRNVQVANADIDLAAISVSPTSVALAAGGAAVPVTLSLATRPASDVVVPLASSSASLSGPSVTFTNSDWSPRSVMVSAPASATAGSFTIVTGAPTTADSSYVTIDPADVSGSISASADVALSMSGPPSATAGANAAFGLTLTNNGPSNANAVALSDPLPTGATLVSIVQNSGSAFNCSGTGSIACTIASMAPGTATFTVTYKVDANAASGSMLANAASVASSTSDPAAGNNNASASATIATSADLAVTKGGPGNVNAGSNISYTITVANGGPSDAQNVALSDPQPANTTFVSEAQGSGPAFNCTTSGGVNCGIATLGAGASATFTIVDRVDASVPSGTTITNTASVASSTSDPSLGNNSQSSSATTAVSADVAIAKTGPPGAAAGSNVTYNVVVTNNGPSDAQNVSWSDVVPPATTYVSSSQASGPAFNCSGTSTLNCSVATLAAGTSAAFTLVDNVASNAADGSTITNTATVTVSSPDPVAANNTQSTSAIVSGATDLALTMSGPSTAIAGSTVTYTSTLKNNGPNTAFGVVLSDPLPAGLALVSMTQTSGPSFVCSGSVSCAIATLPASSTATFTLVARVGASVANGSTITNTASVTAASPDPVPGNETQTSSATVSASADLRVAITASASALAGTNISYDITLTNNGPSDAQSVVLNDLLPAGTTFVSGTQASGPAFNCTTSGSFYCSIGTLASSASATFTVVVAVPVTTPNGTTITNSAVASSITADPAPSNNTASASTVIDATVALTMTKTASPPPYTSGAPITYTIRVTNSGPGDAANVVVTDVIPSGTAFVSATPSQGSCSGTSTVTCALGTIANGGAATISLVLTLPQTPAMVSNTALVTTSSVNTNGAGATATAAIVVASQVPALSPALLLLLAAAIAALALARLGS